MPADRSLADVPFSRPAISDAEVAEVVATLKSGWLTTGPRVREFERRVAAYLGAPHAVAVNSCTAALHLSLLASGIGPGDEVITSPLTFCSTANVVVHAGATPVFADVDPVSMNLDPAAVAAAMTSRTRALLPVHLAGRPADVASFQRLAKTHGLVLIDDAAHCFEGWSGGRKIGTSSDFTCFSFYATKNLTTGEGGMVTTGSESAAAWIRRASLHGMTRDAWARYGPGGRAAYDVVLPGFKCNMTDLQAAIGLRQLDRLDAMQERRAAIWHRYDQGLDGLPLRRPLPVPPGDVHARHLYTVLIDEEDAGLSRDAVAEGLGARGVATSVHFHPVHLFSYYRERFGYREGALPHAESIAGRTLSLPLSGATTEEDVDRVIDGMREILGRAVGSPLA